MGNHNPILIYDNKCKLCTDFAIIVSKLSRSIRIIGHYSKEGEKFRNILGSDATKMFWIIIGDTAYGGRCGLLPLLKEVLKGMFRRNDIHIEYNSCSSSCSFTRITSLLTKGKKIKIV